MSRNNQNNNNDDKPPRDEGFQKDYRGDRDRELGNPREEGNKYVDRDGNKPKED